MKVFPFVLDTRPGYLGRSAPGSLLLMPLGRTTLLDHINQRLGGVGQKLTVVPGFEPTPAYEQAVRGACGRVESVVYGQELAGHLSTYEPSDWLLMIDPRCLPASGQFLEMIVDGLASSPPWVRHLLALESNAAVTRECVEVDADGRVRRIQLLRLRHAAGPSPRGVCCSARPRLGALWWMCPTSLPSQLRTALLASRGVPSHDLPCPAPPST